MKQLAKSVSGPTALVLCACLSACGGSSSSPSAPTVAAAPTPAPCVQTVLLQGSGSLPARTIDEERVSVSAAGRLDVVLDWTFAESPIGLYIVQGPCSLDTFNARTCNFLARSESGSKPRRVSASNVTPGTYSVLIANFATVDEALSLQVFQSSSTCPALAGASSARQSANARIDYEVVGILGR